MTPRRWTLTIALCLGVALPHLAQGQHAVCWDLCRDRESSCTRRCPRGDHACPAACARDGERCRDSCASQPPIDSQ